MNLFIQADTLSAFYNSCFSNSLSNALAISTVFTTICFSSLASFWNSNDIRITGWLDHSVIFVNQEGPSNHTLGNFDIKEPLLLMSTGLLSRSMRPLNVIILPYFSHPIWNKWFITSDWFNQHNTTLLSPQPNTDLMFLVFSADNTLNTKFEPMWDDTSSNLGIVTSFLDIGDSLTNNSLLVTLGWKNFCVNCCTICDDTDISKKHVGLLQSQILT